jgi:deoxyhypusine synthase
MMLNTASLPGASAVLVASAPVPSGSVSVNGPDFESPLDLQSLLSSYDKIGFQATSLGKAIHIVNRMVHPHSHYICV